MGFTRKLCDISVRAVIAAEFHASFALVRLNRPERRNALGAEMTRQLGDLLRDLGATSSIGAVVLAGAAPGFCAGSDLKELAGLDAAAMGRHEAEIAALCRSFLGFPKPLIAAVEGFAIGGGFVLAASADVVVTARPARWHLPEVPLGWIVPWGLPAVLRRTGWGRARQLAWGAEPIDGSEAHRIGLADVLAEAGEAERAALALAGKLAALPREAVAETKAFFNHMLPYGDPAALDTAATEGFERNCRTTAAQATFARFAKKENS